MKVQFYKWFILGFIWLISSTCFSQVAKKDSVSSHEAAFKNASKLIDSAKYEQAIPLLKKATKENPNYWEAFNKMAYAKIKLKDYKNALKDLDKAEKIAPLNYQSIKLRAIAFYETNKFNEAKVAIDTAIYLLDDEKSDDPEIFYYRALLMFKGKSYKAALETCDNTLDIKPNYIEVIQLKGEIRFARKEYNYAIKDLSEALTLMDESNRNYYAYKLRAKSKFEVGDYGGAVLDWDAYIDGMPEEEEALVSRASAKINKNDNSGAINDLDLAIKINPKNPVSFCYRGVAKGGNKQYVEALNDLDFSIKLKFDYPAAYVNRAAIKMASKDKRGACEDLGKADGLGDEMAVRLYEKYCRDMQK
ncbi:tetratricopeptide repeat protein [Aurantibacillus circumpalustris]|uniref:tetratricopeptide repeat protein n=1 Tax=Aurantibacillus circumpalustris TaxID=3036359 RepID=UPI00295A98A1|nr:tetratricopeptide repeat protein [Aurantibacillus circumpalustris]